MLVLWGVLRHTNFGKVLAQLIVTSFEMHRNQLRLACWPIEVSGCRLVRCRSTREVSTARLLADPAADRRYSRLGYYLLYMGKADLRQGLTRR